MEAKDTLLSDEKMEDIFQASHRNNGRKEIFREIALTQANISFKAGIKEVVEWIRKANHSGDFYYSFDQAELQAKLKEWEAQNVDK